MNVLNIALALMLCVAPVFAETPSDASQKAVLEDYITKINDKESEAMFCFAKRINGKDITNAFSETKRRSYGKGNRFYFYLADRKLDPGILSVTLRCEYAFARPIDAMLGSTPSLEGTIDFEPEAGKDYEVRADFEGTEWAIWIRDARSHSQVSKMVYGLPSR